MSGIGMNFPADNPKRRYHLTNLGNDNTFWTWLKQAKQTLGKLQARAAQRELLRESKGTKTQLKKSVLKFASTEWITKQKSQTVISRKIDPS